MFSRNQM